MKELSKSLKHFYSMYDSCNAMNGTGDFSFFSLVHGVYEAMIEGGEIRSVMLIDHL